MIRMMETTSAARSSTESQRQRDLDSKLAMLDNRGRMAEKEVSVIESRRRSPVAMYFLLFALRVAGWGAQGEVGSGGGKAGRHPEAERREEQGDDGESSSEGECGELREVARRGEHGVDRRGATNHEGEWQQGAKNKSHNFTNSLQNSLHEAELKQIQVESEVKKREYEHKINELQKELLDARRELGTFQQKAFQQTSMLQQESMGKEHEMMTQMQTLELAAQSAQMNAAMLQNQITQLKQDNAELNRRLSAVKSNPTISQFGELAQRLTDLERRSGNRQEELEEVILANKESNRKEAKRLEELHAEEIEEKDRQIRFFKVQLDQLMEEFRGLGIGGGGGGAVTA